MQETNDEELKDLCEILLRIGEGEPMTSILEEAVREYGQPPSGAERISTYERRTQADIAGVRSDGLAQLVDVLSAGSPEWAKGVIQSLWKEGHNRLVLQALFDLAERPRNRILFAMQETNDEELKDLCDILLRIAAGEPRTSILEAVAKE